jgi:FkbM family methyltransferase
VSQGSMLIPQAVVLALGALAQGERETARALFDKIAAVPDVADSYRHLIRLLADRLGTVGQMAPERDQAHPFFQPPASCQIPGLGALYERLFGLKRDGVFVEVGAFDGEWLSNTCCLADLGWSGVMIEPNPVSFALCKARHQENSGVHVVNCAVGPTAGMATLYLGEALSTTVPDQVELYRGISWARVFHSGQRVEVPQIRLDSLLETSGTEPGFDLLAIDVEGAELSVMNSFDLGFWLPRVAIIELTDVNRDFKHDRRTVEECAEIRARFQALGYTIRFGDEANTVFARDT